MLNFSYKILFDRVFDPIAILKVDIESNNITLVDVNQAYEKLMKLSRDDLIGRNFNEVWPNSEPMWQQIIRECVMKKKTLHTVGESSSKNVKSYLEAVAFPIYQDMAVIIFLDRTKLKRSDNELRRKQRQLRELAAQLTIIEEKTRREIASYLHDRVGYDLILQLKNLREIDSLDDLRQIKSLVKNLITSTENIISENRSLLFELSPPVLKEAGLNPALNELAKNILEPHGIFWEVISKGDKEIFRADDSICVILYRMSRELLINIVKHSQATHVNIIINRKPESITVAIEDNGTGLVSNNKGFGLFSIRERLIALGGKFKIISESGKGLMAVMTCPLKLKNGEILHDTDFISRRS